MLIYLVEYLDGGQEHVTGLQLRERVVEVQGVDAMVSGEMPAEGGALVPGCAVDGSLESDGRRRLSEMFEGCEHQGDEANVCSNGACGSHDKAGGVADEAPDEPAFSTMRRALGTRAC